ncbi:hypothetical protein [Streptomyces graminofaciens]|uniref:hypothetical protein n=1 Tax=Streptomyces graminofaciens TaxID=68212 RepID=UPI0025727BBD|nr:hypothetical protein [Streptomyces graminofaciens]
MATIAVSVVNAALFAPSARAAENTWIKMEFDPGADKCLTARTNELSSGRWGVRGEECRWGDRFQLWDRRGANIVKAYTNQCLDGNWNGEVYYMEYNGGDYQKWNYTQSGHGLLVKNAATGRLLSTDEFGWFVTTQSVDMGWTSRWEFSGGE